MLSPRSSILPSLLAGVAAGSAVHFTAASAAAAQVTYDPPDTTFQFTDSVNLNFDLQSGYSGTSTDLTNGEYPQFSLGFNTPTKPLLTINSQMNNSQGQVFLSGVVVRRFDVGSSIGPDTGVTSTAGGTNNSTSYTLNGNTADSYTAGNGGFIGLTAVSNALNPNAPAGTTLYGWAEVAYNTDNSLTFYRFGYDDSGAASTTPGTAAPGNTIQPVPEPGALASAAALGAAGFLAWRRRRSLAQREDASREPVGAV